MPIWAFNVASMHLLQQLCSLQPFMWTAFLCKYERYWQCLLCFQSDLVDQNLLNFLPLGEHSEVFKALSTHILEGETLTPDYLKSKNPFQTWCFYMFIISSWPKTLFWWSLSLSVIVSFLWAQITRQELINAVFLFFFMFCLLPCSKEPVRVLLPHAPGHDRPERTARLWVCQVHRKF